MVSMTTNDDRAAGQGGAQGTAEAEPVRDWRVAHAALTRLAARKAGYDADEARWLVAGKATGVHVGCGYGSYLEYLERIFGYRPRLARERIRVAEALVRLPETMAALSAGTLRWSAVREVTRVATTETERDWVEAAAGKAIREVEEMVAGRVLGDRPGDRPRPEERTHVLRLELKGPTYAIFRQVFEATTREAGHSLSDDEAMRLICHRALAGAPAVLASGPAAPDDPGDAASSDIGDSDRRAREPGGTGTRDTGRASYQIVRGRCVDCERRWQEGGGQAIEVDEVALEVADCDAQFLGMTHVGLMPLRLTRPSRARTTNCLASRRA